jgi:hypothetical protein
MNRATSDLPTDVVTSATPGQQDEIKEKSSHFIAQLDRTLAESGEDVAMRFVYRYFYSLRKEKNYRLCDRILEDVGARQLPPVVLTAFLTITAPLRKELPHRTAFYASARVSIESVRGADATSRLLVGLE